MDSPFVGLRCQSIYGLRVDIVGNVHFNGENEVIYPAERLIVFQNYVMGTQRIFRMSEKRNIENIQISPNRELLACCEVVPRGESYIYIYDVSNMRRRRVFNLPESTQPIKVLQMEWTQNSVNLVVLTKPPNQFIIVFSLQYPNEEIIGNPTGKKSYESVDIFACCLTSIDVPGNVLVVAAGTNFICYLNRTAGVNSFSEERNSTYEVDFQVTSMAFIKQDYLLVGTANNEIILLHENELLVRFAAFTCEFIDLQLNQQEHQEELRHNYARYFVDMPRLGSVSRVQNMKAFKTGFAFVIFNKIFVFERCFNTKFERKSVVTLPIGVHAKKLYEIKNWTVSTKEDTVVATARHTQIYAGVLIVPETLRVRLLQLQPLGMPLHLNEIISISVCKWKPIIITAALDRTVRIWNYHTHKLELNRFFAMAINLVALHPMGILVAIAFKDRVRTGQIYMDDLNLTKTYPFSNSKALKYSNLGAFLLVAHGKEIAIVSFCYFNILHTLIAHRRTVTDACWSNEDKYIVSCDGGGVLIQWEVQTGNMINRINEENANFQSIAISSDIGGSNFWIYAISNKKYLSVYKDMVQYRSLELPSQSLDAKLNYISMNKANRILFICNDQGDLFNLEIPLPEQKPVNDIFHKYNIHSNGINYLTFTADDNQLVTGTTHGSLLVLSILNGKGKTAPCDANLLTSNIILIPRDLLVERNEQLRALEVTLREQTEAQQALLTQAEKTEEEHMFEVEHSYCLAMHEMNQMYTDISKRHAEEVAMANRQLKQLLIENRDEMNERVDKCSETQLIQISKFNRMRDLMLEMNDMYECKLKYSEETLNDIMASMQAQFQQSLDERRDRLGMLLKEYSEAKQNFILYCLNTDDENGRHFVALQVQYEQKLYKENVKKDYWVERAKYVQLRFLQLTKNAEDFAMETLAVREQHQKSQESMAQMLTVINDLKREIAARDRVVELKAARIEDLQQKNTQLQKYKLVLASKIDELRTQLAPKESNELAKQVSIAEVEEELAGMKENHATLCLQLKELKSKYSANQIELNLECHRGRAARDSVQAVCLDLHNLCTQEHTNISLIVALKQLFRKYSNNDYFKYTLSYDPIERDVLQRKRALMERVYPNGKYSKTSDECTKKKKKLNKEYEILCEEYNNLVERYKRNQLFLQKYEDRITNKHTKKLKHLKAGKARF